MHIQQITPDVYSLVGRAFASNSTVIIAGDEALLVDAMASRGDAEDLRAFVETELGKRVRFIICTHFFSDHIAALKLFPDASVIAHENYTHTFAAERFRTEEEREHFVEPDILISDGLKMRWGRFRLDIFYNPGHTMSTINIDIPGADLLLVGDNIVGNLVYIYYSTPELARKALERLRRRARTHIIEGHQGVLGAETVDNALHYLSSLEKHVRAARGSANGQDSILKIDLEECLPPGVAGTPFERTFHGRNLQTIIERGLFTHETAETAPASL
jgi:cyclase